MLNMGAAVAVVLTGVSGLVEPDIAAAACQGPSDMAKDFLDVYPTGGHAARFDGDHGGKVIQGLAFYGDSDGGEVVFFYSGDGPTTGARGRYMYMILNRAGCILHSDWVDGDTFDRVSSTE